MIDLANVAGFALVSLAIAMAPGASWIYVIHSTASQGRAAGLVAVAGNGTGILVHAAAAALGITAIIAASEILFEVIKWVGVGFLIYVGVRMIVDRRLGGLRRQRGGDLRTYRRIFFEGALVNILNPKMSLLMFALLPQFIDLNSGSTIAQTAMLGTLHALIASVVLTLLSLFTGYASRTLSGKPAVETALRWIGGLLLIGFGAKLALSEAGSS